MKNKIPAWIIIIIPFAISLNKLIAAEDVIAKIQVRETAGLVRSLEYIELQLQFGWEGVNPDNLNIIAEDSQNGEQVPCQVYDTKVFKEEKVILVNIIFPASFEAHEKKIFLLKKITEKKNIATDLNLSGEGINLVVENSFYRANLSKTDQSEAKNNDCGQLCDLFVKKFNLLLFRTENRMHWEPSFQKPGLEYYSTIAGWQNPKHYIVNTGPYLILTQRQDYAPDHPEILLTADYYFYAGLPYFKFFSSMDIVKDVTLILLRNDEMTMDSLFTNVAYQNNTGAIIDLPLSKRYNELDKNPIANNSPWVCFYNIDKGYAFGCIRIKYDNTNDNGLPSPEYHAHTKISDGAEGGKYWNRCLIDNYPVFVPKGSAYREENAYLLFEINKEDKFKNILEQMNIIRNPVEVTVIGEERK